SQIGELTYTYDANGNQTGWQDTTRNQHREILWDEENRIRAIADNGLVNHYIYDASGERVIKSNGDGQVIKVNGFPMGGKGTTGNYSMYVNPFMVVNSMKFTKHFYIEGQRIVSKLGDMGENQELLNPKDTIRAGNNGNHPIDWDNKHESLKDQLIENFEELGLTGAVFTAGKSGKIPYGQIKKYYRNSNGIIDGYGSDSISARNYDGNKAELLQFYYHPDHLGSSNYITNVSGEVYQHMEYFPFGETFIEERTDAEYTTYLYNGKEFDEEIGLYYYGARYYDPRISMFYGVDRLAEKALGWTPYRAFFNNPLRYIDPEGNFEVDKQTEKNNPELVKYLKNLVKEWNNQSQDFKKAFMQTSGLSEKDVVSMLTYGSGPKLEVAELDKDTNGDGKIDKKTNGTTRAARDQSTGKLKNSNNGKGLIKLDNDVVGMYENATTAGDKQVGKIMVESTLFHEGTHYGNLKTSGTGHGTYPESGKAFEKKVYGQDIGRSNVRKYWKSKQIKPLTLKPIKIN
ncbi:MAG: hypothetical protein GQ564_08385, partial [Bacteroidales bacterium]|nr:hypothetical protein [Bacteroidales bacterium]